mmetsp:Transcript_7918/g.15390  ORF Transcript_7918/g.15390 Transcript_7918/m.15390 type:complete len:139 (+) Transcript_7918:173-589(+)
MPSTAFFLKGAGALFMVHAAYSCMHYRSLLQDMDLLLTDGDGVIDADLAAAESSTAESTTTTMAMMIPPLDVYAELGLAFALLLLGELIGMGPLQSVELGSSSKPLAAPSYRTRDFDVYSNRSKIMLHRVVKVAGKTE